MGSANSSIALLGIIQREPAELDRFDRPRGGRSELDQTAAVVRYRG